MLTIIWQCRVAMNLQIVRKKKYRMSVKHNERKYACTLFPTFTQSALCTCRTLTKDWLSPQVWKLWHREQTVLQHLTYRTWPATSTWVLVPVGAPGTKPHGYQGMMTLHRNHYQRVITSPLGKYLQTIKIKKIQGFFSVNKIHLPSWEGIQFLHPFNKFWRKSSFPWICISFVWFYETSSCKAIDVYIEYNTTNSIQYWHWTILICV